MNYKQWMDKAKSITKDSKFYPVIAGGALRDTLLGKPVKDIDVFMVPTYDDEITCDYVIEFCKDNDIHIDFLSAYEEDEVAKTKLGIISTGKSFEYEGDMFETRKIVFNYIFMGKRISLYTILDTFDFGLCKIAMNISKQIIVHPDFWEDALNKTLTLFRYRSDDRKLERIKRMTEKYYNYKLIDKTQ